LDNLKEKDYLEDIGIDARIILKLSLKIDGEVVDRIRLAQDRDKV
jgi:hypothetical protein